MTEAQKSGELPIDIAGSSTFAIDPKVLASRTFNMIISDDWFVDYAGYKKVLSIVDKGKGRGEFTSTKANKLILVINNKVFAMSTYSTSATNSKSYNYQQVGTISSFSGDVFIAENNTNQIAICDKHNIYIYNHTTGDFDLATLPEGFIPGYVAYQNGRFITPDLASPQWALSAVGDGLNWFWGSSGDPVLGGFQTKADIPVATIPVPGKGNLLFVMGSIVTEIWSDIGGSIFPYQKSSSVNIDYGCLNSATIASSDEIVAWLGANEKSEPAIMFSTGTDIQQISTDGINNKLSQLQNPQKSCAFFIKISGHLIYQITFYDKNDNYSLIYDFNTKKFFDVTDEEMNYHIARRSAFFDNDYYIISLNDGNVYLMNSQLNTFDYGKFSDESPKVFEIPRVRICKNIRINDTDPFIVKNVTFTLEQGNDIDNTGNNPDYRPSIGLCLSKDGGVSFGSYVNLPLNKVGRRPNKINWWKLGRSNDLVLQFRFWSRGPYRATNGVVRVGQ